MPKESLPLLLPRPLSRFALKTTALATTALGAALTALGAALITGCGGGGGGGGGGSSPQPTPTTPPTTTQIFGDNFLGTSLDTSRWGVYNTNQIQQRTRMGFTPQLLREGDVTFARMRLDSNNPLYANNFKGTEIYTRERFARGQGIEFESRLRAPNLPPGIVFAFFGIYDRYVGAPTDANYRKTEIDFEFLTAEQEQFNPRNQRRRLYLNVWNDWSPSVGFDLDSNADTTRLNDDKTYQIANVPNFDWAGWHTYKVRWLPDRTEFYVDNILQRTEREVKPDEAMSIHLNIWAGLPDFNQAYSASLVATNAANNRSYFMDVDFVRVRRLGAAPAAAALQEEPLPANLKSYRNR